MSSKWFYDLVLEYDPVPPPVSTIASPVATAQVRITKSFSIAISNRISLYAQKLGRTNSDLLDEIVIKILDKAGVPKI